METRNPGILQQILHHQGKGKTRRVPNRSLDGAGRVWKRSLTGEEPGSRDGAGWQGGHRATPLGPDARGEN